MHGETVDALRAFELASEAARKREWPWRPLEDGKWEVGAASEPHLASAGFDTPRTVLKVRLKHGNHFKLWLCAYTRAMAKARSGSSGGSLKSTSPDSPSISIISR